MQKLSEITPPIGKILVIAKNGKKIPYFFTGSKLSLITLREQYEYFEVPVICAETFIKEHFSEQAENLTWFPVLVAIAEGYVNYLNESTDGTKEYIDTVGNCANCGVEFHIHKNKI